MDVQPPIWAEVYWIRTRSWLQLLLQMGGVFLVLLGTYNMFVVPLSDLVAFAPYRMWGVVVMADQGSYYLGDVLVMCIGAVIAWFV